MKAVMLMFDSLNRGMLEPYGCDWTKTPNFKRLAERTVRFDQCYAGSLPCMPARRELHTGRCNFLHRSWGPVEPFDDSVPQILRENGVYSHLISDHMHYWEDGGATYHQRYNSWEIIRGQEGDKWKCLPELFDEEKDARIQNREGEYFHATRDLQRHDAVNRRFMKTEEETSLAKTFQAGLEYLEANHDCDRWFLQIECFDPHEPFFSPEAFKRLYPDGYEGPETDWPPYHHVTEDRATAQHYRYQYAALLSMCDCYLGRLLDQFDELDLWKDTMLIVNTDHGYLLGEHGWWSKVVMPCYDEIVHLPLFIHDPRFDCAGTSRDELVQTVDLAATVLEFFGLERPEHMQGRPVRPVLEENRPIRDYALFGIHGAHVNIFDGRYVYMKAPVSEKNAPLNEYTTMPTHMRALFSVGELRNAEAVSGDMFSFTKGCPVWKIPKGTGGQDFSGLLIHGKDSGEARHIDNNSLVNAANFGDLLFDMTTDPHQENPLNDAELEVRMANLLQRAMKENECPPEQFERIGLPGDVAVTAGEIRRLHGQRKEKEEPSILPGFSWTKGAMNTYRALLRFIPADRKEEAVRILAEEISERVSGRTTDHEAADGGTAGYAGDDRSADHYAPDRNQVDARTVLECVPAVVPEDYVEMVEYFVELAGRTS